MTQANVMMVVQVNGKVRAKINVPADSDESVVLHTALADEGVQRHMDGKTIRKQIVVPNKLVNIVVG